MQCANTESSDVTKCLHSCEVVMIETSPLDYILVCLFTKWFKSPGLADIATYTHTHIDTHMHMYERVHTHTQRSLPNLVFQNIYFCSLVAKLTNV